MVKDREFYKSIFKIALPSAFQALISFLVVIADNVMVSYVGDKTSAQAAVAQVNSVTAFYTATVLGLVGGSTVLISQYWGKKDTVHIKKIFKIVICACLFVALLFTLIIRLFPQGIIALVIKSDETAVAEYALIYLGIICFSYIPYALSFSIIGMLRAVEVVRVTLYITVTALFTNITLNYVLIFGKFGFPELGVAGAAIATVICRIVEMIIVWIYAFKVQKNLPIKLRDLLKTEKYLIADYIKYGLPVGVTDMQWALIGMLKAAIIGQMGATLVAAGSIAGSMMELGTMFTFALAGGACVVIGKTVGRGEYELAKKYSKTIQIMFLTIGICMSGIILLIHRPFISLYGSSSDPEVYNLSVKLIMIIAVTIIGTSYHAGCFLGINRGGGDSRFVALVDMICGWFVVLPSMLLAAFVFHAPLPVVFLCSRIDQCFKWIVALIRLRSDKWIRNVTHDGKK